MTLISLPNAADLRQVARWHDTQAKIKKRRKLLNEAKRHAWMANDLRAKANKMEQA